ncbi:MAG TPA: cation diffusion facilitator family transporter [Ktedonobacterales bacterium]|nr:cation diffusion facilitator family transporter [Ktedonobacterales bacterium]
MAEETTAPRATRHAHDDDGSHGHTHDAADSGHAGRRHAHSHTHAPGSERATDSAAGLRVVMIATAGMLVVAAVEFGFFAVSRSAGLLSDALHNLGDVLTTTALWIAFLVARRPATPRHTYGFHRAEDLAGAFIALVIVVSAGAAAFESYRRLVSNAHPTQLGWGIAAALFGFAGNEVLAQYKMRAGERLHSQPLIADGQHSRADGLTSLAAAAGLFLVAMGVPKADPIAGLLISAAILYILTDVGKEVFGRLMDAVDPALVEQMRAQAVAVPGVREIADLRARWAGRRLYAAMNIGVDGALPLAEAHTIAERVRQEILAHVPGVAAVDVHVDPVGLDPTFDAHRWLHQPHDDAGEDTHGHTDTREEAPPRADDRRNG